MSMNMEINPINCELAFYDVMDIVCTYLHIKDLNNLTKVNKSWRDAALREKAKRFYILDLRLSSENSNLANYLDANSFTSLLICNRRFRKSINSLLGYQRKVSHKVIVLKVCEYLTTNMELQDKTDSSKFDVTGNLDVLAVFFPKVARRARIYVAWTQGHLLSTSQGISFEANRLAEELGMKNCEYSKSTLLLFENWFSCYRVDMLNELRKRVQKGKQMTSTYVLGDQLVTASCPGWMDEQNMVALRICGPRVESCSVLINPFAPSHVIKGKLLELKEKVTTKQYCIGLLQSLKCCTPQCSHIGHPCGNSYELMRSLKRIFPSVTFVGLFNRFSFSTFELFMDDRNMDTNTYNLDHPRNLYMYTSVTIITYE